MFKFLKEKLKSWVGKARGKFEVEAKPEEKVEEKKKIKEKPAKKEKAEKKKRTKEEIKEEREITEKVVGDLRKEKVEIKTPEEIVEAGEREITAELEKIAPEEKFGFFARLKKIFSYKLKQDDFDSIFSDLEFSLLENNVALEVVEELRKKLQIRLVEKEIKRSEIEKVIKETLKNALLEILIQPSDLAKEIKKFREINKEPYIVLFFGINGSGKTTSIAKFANMLKKNKLSCVLAASDTFRAASIEQLQIHADKLQVKLIAHKYGSDPSAVAFDAIKYAKQHRIDAVLIDTAGRMHTRENLLHEMKKICRVTKPNLKVFVAEAIAGNDAIEQARAFNEIAGIDGSILSKVDVDEKGGAIISIGYITQKPILYLGTGQKYEDIELFDKEKFIKQLGL